MYLVGNSFIHDIPRRVFEDADAGILAGKVAGMQTVDVRKFPGYSLSTVWSTKTPES